MINRRLSPHIDWALIAAILVLAVVGLVMIYSATYDPTTGQVGDTWHLVEQFLNILG